LIGIAVTPPVTGDGTVTLLIEKQHLRFPRRAGQRGNHSLKQGEKAMTVQEASDKPAFPYATHLNILFGQLEMVDVSALAATVTDHWYNQTLCQVNDSVFRLGVMHGEYHGHKHDDDDGFFFCLDGEFLVDLEDRTVTLAPRQGFVVPKGIIHRTRAPKKCVILMIENAGIVPTGD
jgi:mannose-6-phosphate isomerase-like protein (cupin superfamily)